MSKLVLTYGVATFMILFSACESIDVDENDRDALFLEGRVRKELKRDENGTSTYLEAGWASLRGETSQLDYAIDMLTLGGGVDFPAGEHGHIGLGGGFAWQHYDLEIEPVDSDDHNAVGVHAAVEAGWRWLPWLEPYARAGGAAFVDELATNSFFEAGARFHAGEHAMPYAAWRYARYDVDDLEHDLSVDSVELDASGLVVGLLLSF